jgi:hypothetical protein
MSSTSTAAKPARATTCSGGHRYTRAAAVIEAKRAETESSRFRAYRCSTCLQTNGNPAWHVGRLPRWRRWLLGER